MNDDDEREILMARFFRHTHPSNGYETCWIWSGYTDKDGYGTLRALNKDYKAHRLSFLLFYGDIPKGMLICHSCDNPSCVNPKHLFLGTPKDNMDDMIKKNRQVHVRGEGVGNSKLTEEKVHLIRNYIRQGLSDMQIAKIFGVSDGTINFIHQRKIWGWLKDE